MLRMFARKEWLRPARIGLAVAMLLGLSPAAGASEPDPGQTFYKAREAYDAGRLDDAVELYAGLVEDGYATLPVLFNLGNAEFRRGRVAEAVYWYRRAQSVAPRDPDVKANLAFAWQTAGAATPLTPAWERPADRLSRSEWTILLHSGLAGLLLVAALGGVFYGRRVLIWKWSILPALLLAGGLYGLAVQVHRGGHPEAVVMETRDALFAPLDGSTAHFKAPAATVVRRLETQGSWTKVDWNGQEGWLPSATLKVIP